ncbi:MAG: flagellar motor switch protein FliN [Fimbriimonas ginsengisoli]|uniref:Flagellar motor switch protein FliN n=1 Tax=Fimbriimonas ginsengisoli TaxID=1005039 RepID=A0A931LT11_FIMGI|nr:flagellar motor switch protein FliN [Fimbriimonas ginsengisoli]
MASIPTELVAQIQAVQDQIWQAVSQSVSEAGKITATFGEAQTALTKSADLPAEFAEPLLVVQFSFTDLPGNPQVLLMGASSLESLAGNILNEEVTASENVATDVRPSLEAIVQGICLAITNLRESPFVASGLTLRFQPLALPVNLEQSEELVRTQVKITMGEDSGLITWLADSDTIHLVLGLQQVEEERVAPFQQIEGGLSTQGAGRSSLGEGEGSIELILDIPLEISVELGRVKMLVKEVIELSTGSIVEIDKAAGEPVDVMVNGRLVARGEVVVIEDNFGVRITEILNPHERLNRLGEVA